MRYPAFQLGYNIRVEGEPRPKGAGIRGDEEGSYGSIVVS
jgi:hypothetical protein